jgi:hypothetical protein
MVDNFVASLFHPEFTLEFLDLPPVQDYDFSSSYQGLYELQQSKNT